MQNSFLATILLPITFILISAFIKNENVINKLTNNKEYLIDNRQNKSPCLIRKLDDVSGSINQDFNLNHQLHRPTINN